MSESPYYPGYEGWETFDALLAEVRAAHNVVWSGRPVYTNQFRTNTCLNKITPEEAAIILELDAGKHMLAAKDLNGSDIFY